MRRAGRGLGAVDEHPPHACLDVLLLPAVRNHKEEAKFEHYTKKALTVRGLPTLALTSILARLNLKP